MKRDKEEKVNEALRLLFINKLVNELTVPELEATWRSLRSRLHPDKPGGDAEKFHAARQAYESVRSYLLEPKPCVHCDGSGKVEVPSRRGYGGGIVMNCKSCKGSGRR